MPGTARDHFDYTINEWNTREFRQIRERLPEKLDVIYDIGANAGGFTKVLQEKYTDAKFFCFEPVKETFETLQKCVPFATNINKGIYYGVKTSRATWRGYNVGAFFLEEVDSGEPRIFTGEILELVELEELDIPKPTLIKMDIEGAEVNVLAKSKICKECPYLIIEWHPSDDPYEFFKIHLPNHEIKFSLSNQQFLLCQKQA